MKKILIAILLVAIVLIGGWQAFVRFYIQTKVPSEVQNLERSLATPGLICVMELDVAKAVKLEKLIIGKPDVDAVDSDIEDENTPSLYVRLKRAGIDLRTQLKYVVAALGISQNREPVQVVAMIGNFDPITIENFIKSQYKTDTVEIDGRIVLQVDVINPNTCKSTIWGVDIQSQQIIFSSTASIGPILTRLDANSPPDRDITGWQQFRIDQLASFAIFIPEESPHFGSPFAKMGADSAKKMLTGFKSVYMGVGVRPLLREIGLKAQLEAESPSIAKETAERWLTKWNSSKDQWKDTLPSISKLQDAIKVEAQDKNIFFHANLNRSWTDEAKNIPQEFMTLLFSGFNLKVSTNSAAASQGQTIEERIEKTPITFKENLQISKLGPYDQTVNFASKPDVTAGPFGVQLESISLAKDSDFSYEIAVKAMGTNIDNMGKGSERAQIFIDKVLTKTEENVLKSESCGKDRNEMAAAMTMKFGTGLIEGSKTVRLKPGISIKDVTTVSGYVRLKLPTQTKSVILPEPKKGAQISENGVKLTVVDLKPGEIAYNVTGKISRLLLLRALNANKKPLEDRGSHSMDFLFGDGKSMGKSVHGKIDSIEAVIAMKEESQNFPFSISPLRPGSDKEQGVGSPREIKAPSQHELQLALKKAAPILETKNPLATTKSGPFSIALTSLYDFFNLSTQYQVASPILPGLEGNLTGLEIGLTQIALNDGTIHNLPLNNEDTPLGYIDMNKSWQDKTQLAGQLTVAVNLKNVKKNDIQRIKGNLRISIPQSIDSFQMNDLVVGEKAEKDRIQITLIKVGREKLEFLISGQAHKLLAAKAFDKDGKELWSPFTSFKKDKEAWKLELQPHGVVESVKLFVGKKQTMAKYPFVFIFSSKK